jgi:pyridoxamine 5'-phosphate oxidase-like protein
MRRTVRGMARQNWSTAMVTTVLAWAVAWALVCALLTAFAAQMGALPLALRALVMSGVLVVVMVNVVMPILRPMVARRTSDGGGGGGGALLPTWPTRTVAMLATVGDGPHVIPVSAPVRAGDDRILLSLHRTRGSLERLRRHPEVALLVLAGEDTAFTARGRASVVEEPMACDADYAAVAIDVTAVDDHRQRAFTVAAGIDRRWVDEAEQRALGARVQALSARAAQPDRA